MLIPIMDVATRKEYSVAIRFTGEGSIRCPVCADDRKKQNLKPLHFNAAKGTGYCHHCQAKFVKKSDRPYTPKREYVKPAKVNTTGLSDSLVKWFESRGIGAEVLAKMKIGEGKEYMPQVSKEMNTVQFNYFKDGEVVNVKYRTGNKLFKMVSEAELTLYNIDNVRNAQEVIITEGEMDCLSFMQAGYPNAVSVPNGAGKNLSYLDDIIDYFLPDTRFIIAVDNDNPGKVLRDELIRRFGAEYCSVIEYPEGCKDANDVLMKSGVQGVVNLMESRRELPVEGIFTANDIQDDIMDYWNNGLPEGYGLGEPNFDKILKFHTGYITTITGVPGHGKSTFLDWVMCKLAVNHGWRFAMYSPENHPMQLHFSKIAETVTGKSFTKGYNRMNEVELKKAMEFFNDHFYFVNPPEDFTLDNILEKVKSLVRRKGVNAFVIDAWNKLEHKFSDGESQYISRELDKLALFCERNNVHLFLVAHPRKMMREKGSMKYEIPSLYDINGSAAFYNKTSNGICVYKDAESKMSIIYVQKVKFKHWGATGNVEYHWDWTNNRYNFNAAFDTSNWLVKESEQQQLPVTEYKPVTITNPNAFTEPVKPENDEYDNGEAPF